MGESLLAAFGVGLLNAEQVRKGWVSLKPRASPRPEASVRYRKLFASYKALYPALKDVMHTLHG